MKVAVIGVGHVGLVTCATLATLGHDVVAVDVDASKIGALEAGRIPFHEPGLLDLVRQEVSAGRLRFTTVPSEAIAGAEIVLICVGTPPSESGAANIEAVDRSAADIARFASRPIVVVEKSTVPAGTAARLREDLALARPDVAFHVVSNPEFLREGQAVADSLEPERILVGADDEIGLAVMRQLYQPLIERGHRIIETDVVTAELAKHAANAFLALKISYANALARVCELVGADVVSVTDVMGADPRIGPAFLAAGIGYGGYCFPKDVAAFEALASSLGYPFPLLTEIARINGEAIASPIVKLRESLPDVEGRRIAILGLSFKPHTDDVRLSPALKVAERLVELGADVVGYDPVAMENARRELPSLATAADAYEAVRGAEAVIVGTAWPEFRDLDLLAMHAAMARPLVIDGRNVWDPAEMRKAGFSYRPTGRASVEPDQG
jgi:UDPglucose 6-dehydrogenase